MANIITKSPYICAPNIMDTPDYKTKHVKLDMTGTDCIKAGSPINDDGKVANDESAIGILLYDCHACLGARRGVVVIDGRIKQDVAAEHSGITISDEAKAAMVNISFTGDGSRMGGGSGLPSGSKPNQYIVTDGDGNAKWEDKLCWIEKEVILEERTLSFQEQGGMFIAQVEQFDMPIDFDATYTVVWDGKEYDCPVVESAFGEASLGNPNLVVMPSDLGEPDTSMSVPFLCAYMYIDGNDKSSGMLGVLATTGGEHTIGIFRNVAKKIHPDFLPTGVPYISEEKVEVNKDNFSIYEGEVYEVIHKGLAYRCVCKRLDYWGFSAETVFYLGNVGTTDEIFGYGEDCTGEPFCYHTSVDDFGHSVTKSFGSENVTAIYKVNRVRVGGNTIFFVQSSTQGQGDTFLYRTEDGANNYDEAQRVTKSELEAAFFAGAISVKDISLEWYFMPMYVRFDRDWGQMMINEVFVCRTAEYAEAEG